MADMLCRWLNQELQLSKVVGINSLVRDFSSGYLIGEILHKYGLQDDFNHFLKKNTSISKVNNFMRLEPSLKLLGISFNMNTAQELMQEKQGVAAQLLFQLYDALKKRKSPEMNRSRMEVEQPRAETRLYRREHKVSYRLPQVMKRDAYLKLQLYSDKHHRLKDRTVVRHRPQLKSHLNVQEEKIMKNTEKATDTYVPKPPYRVSPLIMKRRQRQIQEEAKRVQTEIAQFEKNMRKSFTYGFYSSSSIRGQSLPADLCDTKRGSEVSESGAGLQPNTKYMQEIQQRLMEKALASERRQKRQDRFLVEQFKAQAAQQQELQQDEQLVKRLTRQTKQEQRLVTQLLQMRRQKEVIRENRLFVEQQYQERREKDFREALNREAVLAQQEKAAREEEIRKDIEACARISVERSQIKQKKHFNHCKDLFNQIVDLATKVGDYRQLTENTIPEQTMNDWKELLFKGLPLYESNHEPSLELSASKDCLDLKKLPQEALNNLDYVEYARMIGDWAWPEDAGEIELSSANSILENVVRQLKNIVCASVVAPPSSEYSPFTIKACVLGNICSGKTSCLARIAEALSIHVFSSHTLIEEALKAYHNGEEVTDQREEKNKKRRTSRRLSKQDINIQESRSCISKLSPRALLGAAVDKELKKGNAIPNELLVEIITHAIRQVPAHSGWILDGFPSDISLAHLLEKALGGCEEEEKEVVSDQTNVIADCNPPSPPPTPAPVLDVVLMLNISDECAVRRAYRQVDTWVEVSQPAEKILYLAEITHRIAAFREAWPALEKWYCRKQNILVNVDADVDEDELCNRVKLILQQVMERKQRGGPSPRDAQPQSSEHSPPLMDNRSTPTKLLSRAEVEKTPTPKEGQSRSGTPTSLSQNESPVPTKRLMSALSCSLDYMDEPLSSEAFPLPDLLQEISPLLWSLWASVCNSYVSNVKKVMQQLRSQRTVILHELSSIREGYKHSLGRSNLKQEFVRHWQKDFNSIPDYLREDDEIKPELHLRLDELCERLWDITDKCREQDDQRKAALVNDEWLEEHAAVLINSHSTLMQVELNRFHQTLYILRIYFLSLLQKQVTFEPLGENTCIPLLEIPEVKAENKSENPVDTNVVHKGQEKSKKVTLPQTRPASPKEVSMTTGTDKAQPEKVLHDKLISNYEEALKVIEKFPVSLDICELKESDQKEAKESVKSQEKVKEASSKPKKGKGKGKPSSGKLKDDEPEKIESEVKSEKTETKEITGEFQKEYIAALDHEGKRAKMRLELVKHHSLVMLHSLQRRAHGTLTQMETWLQARYLAEMKSIDQLKEMAHHHIAAKAKLQYEVVLEGSDFYLMENSQMAASLAPPPDPDVLEKPSGFMLSTGALESIHHQLSSISPSGLISSSSFNCLLNDVLSIDTGRHSLPKLWVDNQTLLTEITSLLTDANDLIDWRQFLLCASLPWPVPSLAQLLFTLQSFKAADAKETGFLSEEQYLQTELWLTHKGVQILSEDLSDPTPDGRVANLIKFFFQLFADGSVSPPQLDYVSMLQYFSADPDPRQGFVRALSVVLGRPLRQPSVDHLIMSMPSIEEDAKLASLEAGGNYSGSSASFGDAEVSISALLKVICHKGAKMTNNTPLHMEVLSQERHREHLTHIFTELGYKPEECLPFSVLSKHPYIQMLMETSTQYLLVNIYGMLLDHQNKREESSSTVLTNV